MSYGERVKVSKRNKNMAVKNNLGKPKNMTLGAARYALLRCQKNGNDNSKYAESVKERIAELKSHSR